MRQLDETGAVVRRRGVLAASAAPIAVHLKKPGRVQHRGHAAERARCEHGMPERNEHHERSAERQRRESEQAGEADARSDPRTTG
jgi:hypothetical protein